MLEVFEQTRPHIHLELDKGDFACWETFRVHQLQAFTCQHFYPSSRHLYITVLLMVPAVLIIADSDLKW